MTTDYDGFDPHEQVVAELRHLNPGLSETYASALACQVRAAVASIEALLAEVES